jgi:NAD(P)-dependent dehydrogenase (short-subunit alcohol dehydrogenase family)
MENSEKNYLVVGGSSGIGAAIIQLLQSHGQVFSTFNKHEVSSSGKVRYLHYDATADQELSLPVEHLDGLVYCPGTINLKPFARTSEKDFLNDFNVNVLGAVKAIQQSLPLLRKAHSASIVLFSTVAVGQGMSFHSSIAASKGAVEGLAASLAAELAPKIRVNVIAPSIVNTPLAARLLNTEDKVKASEKRHPLQKVGEPADIASMASFLLSSESRWITGQTLHVDGGLSRIKMF